jgi:hypothetical protein
MCGSTLKSGADYSNKLPGMRKAFPELPTNSAILDIIFRANEGVPGPRSYSLTTPA